VAEERERIEELGERAREALEKIRGGLEFMGERLEKEDVPRLVRNVLIISTGAMTVYTMASALATMMPVASQVFTQLGIVLGYMIPIMINVTMFSLMIALVRHLLR